MYAGNPSKYGGMNILYLLEGTVSLWRRWLRGVYAQTRKLSWHAAHIVEADKITGTFATVLKPKTSWKVEYVSETVGEETIVKSIVLAIPEKGLTISIR